MIEGDSAIRRDRSGPVLTRASSCGAALGLGLLFGTTAFGAAAQAPSVPQVSNREEVASAILAASLEGGRVANGTVFAPIRIGIDGRVEALDVYGAPTQDPELARRVRLTTELLRVSAPPEWRASNPDGAWAVFWAFDTGRCPPTRYDTPARVIAILVCTPVEAGRVQRQASSVHIDDSPEPRLARFLPQPRFVSGDPLHYPPRARSARLQGYAIARLTLDTSGRVTRVDYRVDTLGRPFQPMLGDWLRSVRFEVPPGWPPAGHSPAVEMRIAFGLGEGDECAWNLPPLPAGPDGAVGDVRVCASPVR